MPARRRRRARASPSSSNPRALGDRVAKFGETGAELLHRQQRERRRGDLAREQRLAGAQRQGTPSAMQPAGSAKAIAAALSLDMAAWWEPTAEAYLNRRWPKVRTRLGIPVGTHRAEAALDAVQFRLGATLSFIASGLDEVNAPSACRPSTPSSLNL
jgi:hypothetical protein